MEIILLFAIIPLIVNCFLAESKGKSVGMWFVITLFIGWIATIILACSEAVTKCNKCRRDIPVEAKVCCYCGNKKVII